MKKNKMLIAREKVGALFDWSEFGDAARSHFENNIANCPQSSKFSRKSFASRKPK
jgi:hypothetical protein